MKKLYKALLKHHTVALQNATTKQLEALKRICLFHLEQLEQYRHEVSPQRYERNKLEITMAYDAVMEMLYGLAEEDPFDGYDFDGNFEQENPVLFLSYMN